MSVVASQNYRNLKSDYNNKQLLGYKFNKNASGVTRTGSKPGLPKFTKVSLWYQCLN